MSQPTGMGSGGFTPGLVRSDVALTGGADFLASEKMTVKRGGITLDASLVAADGDGNKILVAGTFVTRVTANGKYGKYTPGAVNGTQTPDANDSGYLLESVNLRNGDVINGALIGGSVLTARVAPAPDATTKAAIAGRIILQ